MHLPKWLKYVLGSIVLPFVAIFVVALVIFAALLSLENALIFASGVSTGGVIGHCAYNAVKTLWRRREKELSRRGIVVKPFTVHD